MVTMGNLEGAQRCNSRKTNESLFATCRFVMKFIQELEADAVRDVPRTYQPPRRGTAWIPPPRGDVKGNVDGALSVGKEFSCCYFPLEEGPFSGASVLVLVGAIESSTISLHVKS